MGDARSRKYTMKYTKFINAIYMKFGYNSHYNILLPIQFI